MLTQPLAGLKCNVSLTDLDIMQNSLKFDDAFGMVLSLASCGLNNFSFFLISIIKRTFERWVNSTKQLLNTSRGHQEPRKATHCLRKEVGKNIKNKQKKRDKWGRDRAPFQEGSLKKREVSKHQETFSLPSLCRALEAQRAT